MKRDAHYLHEAVSILGPTGVAVLRIALERLRGSGLSRSEAGAELMRQGLADWMETAEPSAEVRRLRILKG